MEYLILYNKAKQALAEAHSVDELSAIIDQADLIKHTAQISNDDEMVNMAMEIKLRAERRFGEVSSKIAGKQGARTDLGHAMTEVKHEILKAVNVSTSQNKQYEKLAAIPEEKFEKILFDFQKEGEISRAKLMRTVNEEKKKIDGLNILPETKTIDATRYKHPNQILLEQILKDIQDMTTIEEVRQFIEGLIKIYKNE